MSAKRPTGGPRLIIAYKPGQLSNRLLQFAAFIGFSQRTGLEVVNPSFDEYAALFEFTSRDLLCRYPPRPSWLPRGRLARRLVFLVAYYSARVLVRSGLARNRVRVVALEWTEQRLLDESFLREISGAWLVFIQGWRLFVPPSPGMECCGPPGGIEPPEAGLIRAYFRPREVEQQRAESLVAGARRDCDRLVGVHIRQGDFLTDKNQGRYYYSTGQYAQKMREVEAAFAGERVAFLICSNEPQPREAFLGLRCTFGQGGALVEQLALGQCDAIMGPPSSFSMWAAFYGETLFHWIFDLEETITRDSFRPFSPIDQDEFAERFHGYPNAKRGLARSSLA